METKEKLHKKDFFEAMQDLKSRIDDPDKLGYEISEMGDFYLTIKGKKLDIPLSEEKLGDVLKLTSKIMDLYIKGGHKGKEFYSKEGLSSVGTKEIETGKGNNIYMDLKINNRKIFMDTTFLTDESFVKIFGKDPSRTNNYIQEYANFLNNLLGLEVEIK